MEHKPILQMGTDRMILRYMYHRPFMVKFSEKCEWRNRFTPNIKGDLVSYMDRSKINKGSCAAVYRWGSRRGVAAALGSTPQYSRLKYVPLRHV
jgi:hypothetical protein